MAFCNLRMGWKVGQEKEGFPYTDAKSVRHLYLEPGKINLARNQMKKAELNYISKIIK